MFSFPDTFGLWPLGRRHEPDLVPGREEAGAWGWKGCPFPGEAPHFLKELGLDIILMTLQQPDKRVEVRRAQRLAQMSWL